MTTTSPRVGHLFAGYDGIGMAVEAIWPDSQIAWVSDVCKFNKDGTVGHHEPHRAPCSILAHHYPDVPNIGDVTTVDWSQVEPVDILTGGSPCQDLSHAGKRAGMTEGTRSNLWVAMREAIAQIRPSIVIWENVRGAYTAEADSDLVTNPRLLADTRRRDGQPLLRALGRVLGDLSELGYVGGWNGLRAADIGAPHGRFRVFVVAHLAPDTSDRTRHSEWPRPQSRQGSSASTAAERGTLLPTPVATDALGARNSTAWRGPGAKHANTGDTLTDVIWKMTGQTDPKNLLPSPRTSDTNGAGAHGDGGLDLRTAVSLLGTPRASEWKGSGPVGSKSHAHMLDREYLSAQVLSLLPTPRAGDGEKGGPNQHGSSGDLMLPSAAVRLLPTPIGGSNAGNADNRKSPGYDNGGENYHEIIAANRWGQYAPAIHRWEQITRPAPPPTETGPKGNPRLSAAFSEWLMGLTAGWVTDVPGITRNEALKALGNGVVPQQAEAAVRFLLALLSERAA